MPIVCGGLGVGVSGGTLLVPELDYSWPSERVHPAPPQTPIYIVYPSLGQPVRWSIQWRSVGVGRQRVPTSVFTSCTATCGTR